MKKVLKFVVPAVVVFGLSSCGGNAAPSDTTLLTKNGALKPISGTPTTLMPQVPNAPRATTTTIAPRVTNAPTTTMPKIGR